MDTTCKYCPEEAVYVNEKNEEVCKDCYDEFDGADCDYCGEKATTTCVEQGCPCCDLCWSYGVQKVKNLALGLTKCPCCFEWSKEDKKNKVCSECDKQMKRLKELTK